MVTPRGRYRVLNRWLYKGEEFICEYSQILSNNWYGFTYLIENQLTGRKYIGKKSFHTKRKARKKRQFHRAGVFQSDWEQYFGSCDELNQDIMKFGWENFSRTILAMYNSSRRLTYEEEKLLFNQNVLTAKTTTGEFVYYNGTIGGRFFRNIFEES